MSATKQSTSPITLLVSWRNILWHVALIFAIIFIPAVYLLIQVLILCLTVGVKPPDFPREMDDFITETCSAEAKPCALLMHAMFCIHTSLLWLIICLILELPALFCLTRMFEGAWGETWEYCVIGRFGRKYFGPKNLKMGHMESLEAVEKGESIDTAKASKSVS